MARRDKQPVVLTIAGFDPSSGAGITADLQTLAAHGCYGVACITALTVQSTRGVRSVHPVSGAIVRQTLSDLAADLPVAAIKIGMLGSREVVDAVVTFLQRKPRSVRQVVLDPVLKSTSGAHLASRAAIGSLVSRLIPLCTVVTPNLEEATALTGVTVRDLGAMRVAARRLHELGAPGVVVTGGHLREPVDVVSAASRGRGAFRCEVVELPGRRVRSRSTHGTGCAFSSALAANLALGKDLAESARLAKAYVTRAIVTAQPLGRGNGPLNLLWPLHSSEN